MCSHLLLSAHLTHVKWSLVDVLICIDFTIIEPDCPFKYVVLSPLSIFFAAGCFLSFLLIRGLFFSIF